MSYTGRNKIYCDVKEITSENVTEILADALIEHSANSSEIDYLYKYRKGDQPILNRTKEVRPEICNKIVENRADEIVSFKTGYLCGEPLQYISRGGTSEISNGIQSLNDMMMLVGKSVRDKELAEWMYTCGIGYRLVLNRAAYIREMVMPWLNNNGNLDPDEAPFGVFTLDPRYSFVIHYSDVGETPVAGVTYVTQEDQSRKFMVYTPSQAFLITETIVDKQSAYAIAEIKDHEIGMVPLIEYQLNSVRMGAFEVVLSILDAINTVQSNRIDGIEQFVQSLLVFYNVEIDEEKATYIREAGVIRIKSVDGMKADIKELSNALDQEQTQTLVDYMYQTILDIVGMPNRNGGTSTSDTGLAVQLRDGWSSAEARAKSDELCFKESERKFLKAVLRILRATVGTPLTLKDIDVKFTRRLYEGLLVKSQVLTTMLSSNKIAPALAFAHCGLFSDPEDAAKQSQEYYDKVKITIPDTAKASVTATADEPGGDANV